MLEVSSPNAVVSSLKPAHGGGLALRVYEAAGKAAADVRVVLRPKLLEAGEVNLLEDPRGALPIEGNGVSFDLHPFEIKTIRLRLGEL